MTSCYLTKERLTQAASGAHTGCTVQVTPAVAADPTIESFVSM